MHNPELAELEARCAILEKVEAAAKAVVAVHAMGGDLERAVIEMQKVVVYAEFEKSFITGGSFLEQKNTPFPGCKNKDFL